MRAFILFSIVSCSFPAFGQRFSHADSLRGNIDGPGRDWWNVVHYDLSVKFDEKTQQISGSNVVTYRSEFKELREIARKNDGALQIDLQEPLILDSVIFEENGERTKVGNNAIQKDGNAYFIVPATTTEAPGSLHEFTVYYHGKPRKAVTPPWDGGVVWTTDASGKPWITVACQGLGASVWFPCKDTQADEPDSVRMHFTCREDLACISNGRFEGEIKNNNATSTFTWSVSNPINNYCMIPYIGDYVNIHEHLNGEKGVLELDYWVLRGNEEKAKQHFGDVPKTIEAFEFWFGPYPFYEDGYKLIEAPHLGMEHQSAIAYGNGFRNGYLGTDLSGTGAGLKWDFIIVHESGHEWFGNNITTKDIADMWVHEGFTCYSETLFTQYWFDKEIASQYIIGLRKNIMNDKPVQGNYGVNSEGSGDMYYKGANMLHTIRQIVNNDTLFRGMLRGLNGTFYHQTVTGKQIEEYMSAYLKTDLSKIFDQYLREKDPPTLQLKFKRDHVKYRWVKSVKGFNMPVDTNLGRITPGKKWQKAAYNKNDGPSKVPFWVDADYYIFQDSNIRF